MFLLLLKFLLSAMYGQSRTARTGQQAGQPVDDGQNRTARTGHLGIQGRIERSEHDSRDSGTKVPGRDKNAGAGGLDYDSWDRTPRTGHLGQDCRGGTNGTEKPERTVRIDDQDRKREDRMARI